MLQLIAKRVLLAPPFVRHSSQTIYETLLGAIRMYEATGSPQWMDRAREVRGLLQGIQRPDGGFDIGYDFDFGKLHRIGEATSPELVGLIAFSEFARVFGSETVESCAHRAAEWIRRFAIPLEAGRWAIPYGPYSTSEVMVYNGTSFACGALGSFLGAFQVDDPALHEIYAGMIRYLRHCQHGDAGLPGKFWFYNDQTRADLTTKQRHKVDYYHQMQQVEAHAIAQRFVADELQADIVADASEYISNLVETNEVLPYTNDPDLFGGHIHLWGLASVASGFLLAADTTPCHAPRYHRGARKVLDWLCSSAWCAPEQRFYAIVSSTGRPVLQQYMVRSDAWVFAALAQAQLSLGDGSWSELIEPCYQTMASASFSGPETHASNLRTRTMSRLMKPAIWARRALKKSASA